MVVVAAAPVVYVAGRDGINDVRTGDASSALVRGALALVAALVPVVALTVYAHWLSVTTRPRSQRAPHVPTMAEDWFLGALVLVVVVAAWPVLAYAYRESRSAFATMELTAGVGFGLLAFGYVAFAIFCVKRYVDWLH